jgi:hypothetical protein
MDSVPATEAPHDANGDYTCPCGADKYGTPYNRRSIFHAHGQLRPIDPDELGATMVRMLTEARDWHAWHAQLRGER